MPTVASQPSLQQTQAVGAILMHQFARERFLQAGISEDLIREAENIENLNRLTSTLIDDTSSIDTSADQSRTINEQSTGISSTEVNFSHPVSGDDSNMSTIVDDNTRCETTMYGDRFLSMANSSNGFIENTIYHSMNATRDQHDRSTSSNLNRTQSIGINSSYGRELLRIAAEFESTQLRRDIKAKADTISLSDINKDTFTTLLNELFDDGISRVKVVTLFFFCTDVALRAASYTQDLVVKFMSWSFSYIINEVCRWVYELGGWDQILFIQLRHAAFAGAIVIGYLVLGLLLKKTLCKA